MRLIDADVLLERFVEKGQRSNRYKLGENWELNFPEIYDVVNQQPPIDAEPIRHGHWRADETVYTTGEVWCSVCRTLYYIGDLYDVGGGNNLPNYCPHCGAKMDGGNT